MTILATINKTYLQGNQPKELKVESVKLVPGELNLLFVNLTEAKKFISSFNAKYYSYIHVEADRSIVYSIQIPFKFFSSVEIEK